MMNMFFLNSNMVFMILFAVLGLVILVLIASKVYEHATHNNIPMPGIWVLLVIMMPILGLIIYLLVASTYTQRQYHTQPLGVMRPASSPNISSSPELSRGNNNVATINGTEVITQPRDVTTPVVPVKDSTIQGNLNLVKKSIEQRFCPQCGSVVGVDDLFCSYCGTKLQ